MKNTVIVPSTCNKCLLHQYSTKSLPQGKILRASKSLMTHDWMFFILVEHSLMPSRYHAGWWFMYGVVFLGWVHGEQGSCKQAHHCLLIRCGLLPTYQVLAMKHVHSGSSFQDYRSHPLGYGDLKSWDKVFLIFNSIYFISENIKEIRTSDKFLVHSCRQHPGRAGARQCEHINL